MDGLLLVDSFLNRVVTLPLNFYSKGTDATFDCSVYSTVATDIYNVYIATASDWNGFLSVKVTGGSWQNVTSNFTTTCAVGTIIAGGLIPIKIKVNVPISAGVSGSNMVPLYVVSASYNVAE